MNVSREQVIKSVLDPAIENTTVKGDVAAFLLLRLG
jgi:hypothetical protein